jgi:hypothetical protein
LADWFDYHLENDPRFCEENGVRPRELRAGKAIRIEDLKSWSIGPMVAGYPLSQHAVAPADCRNDALASRCVG